MVSAVPGLSGDRRTFGRARRAGKEQRPVRAVKDVPGQDEGHRDVHLPAVHRPHRLV